MCDNFHMLFLGLVFILFISVGALVDRLPSRAVNLMLTKCFKVSGETDE